MESVVDTCCAQVLRDVAKPERNLQAVAFSYLHPSRAKKYTETSREILCPLRKCSVYSITITISRARRTFLFGMGTSPEFSLLAQATNFHRYRQTGNPEEC